MILSAQVLTDFRAHVLKEYPKEACGVQVNGIYHPCTNIADDPTKSFAIPAKEILELEKQGKIEAVFHSHPYDSTYVPHDYIKPHHPSDRDLERWHNSNDTWVIVSTDGTGTSRPTIMDKENPAPLLGREFIWGFQDCYALVRDYYKERLGIKLKVYPNPYGWWDMGYNFITDLFEDAGFTRVAPEKADIHDVCFLKYESKVVNHLGIISGQNELMQQGISSLSRISRLDLYRPHIMMYVRHNSLFK